MSRFLSLLVAACLAFSSHAQLSPFFTSPDLNSHSLIVENTCYVGIDDQVFKFSMDDPDQTMTLIDTFASEVLCFHCDGTYIYVGDQEGEIHRWPISDPNPDPVELTDDADDVICLTVVGDELFFGCEDGDPNAQIRRINLNDPYPADSQVIYSANGWPRDFAQKDGWVYVAFSDGRIERFVAIEQSSFSFESELLYDNEDQSLRGLTFVGDDLYFVSYFDNEVRKIDTNGAFTESEVVFTTDQPFGLQSHNGHLYITTRDPDTIWVSDAPVGAPGEDCETATTDACPYDLDASGIIDIGDLLQAIGQFGCSNFCSADFDSDGFVGTNDLQALLGVFGLIC